MKKAIISATVFLLMFLLCVGNTFAEAEKTEFTGTKGPADPQMIMCGAQWFTGADSEFVHFRGRVQQQEILVDGGDARVEGILSMSIVTINSSHPLVKGAIGEPLFWSRTRMWTRFFRFQQGHHSATRKEICG